MPPMPDEQPQRPAPDADGGLRAPAGALGFLERPRRLTPLRVAAQIVGFAVAVVLLVWCARLAFADTTFDELRALLRAGRAELAFLALLTLASVVANGLGFWVTLRPLRTLPAHDVVAVNAIASFLSYLPFKISALVRVLIHRRRDHVPFRDIIPWLAAYSALSLATLLPLAALAVARPRIDALWLALALVIVGACNGAAIVLGRLSESNRGLAALSLGSWRIVRRPSPVIGCALAKSADVVVIAARFTVAASFLSIALPLDQAVFFALVFFLLSVLSPVGSLGVREGGVVLLGVAVLDDAQRDTLARLVLTVSASEALTLLVLAPLGAWVIRLDRVLLARPAGARAQ